MSILQGILLGLLQGVAEFLPISSSGHLAVAQKLFGLTDVPLLYDVFLHLATLCAVVIFFRKKIWRLLCILGRWITRRSASASAAEQTQTVPAADNAGMDVLCGTEEAGRRTIVAIILSTIVTGILGVFVEKVLPKLAGVEKIDNLPVQCICCGFIITAVVLIVSALYEKHAAKKAAASTADVPAAKPASGITWKQALSIGLAQGIGTLPGISRSGSTIAGGLFCGVDRAAAGEYSFIVSIPAILGAFILEVKDIGAVAGSIGAAPVIAGCITAFVSGYAALAWLMRLIRRGRLEWFAVYLIPAGVLGLLFIH